MTPSVPQPLEILYGDGVGLACAVDGSLHAEELHGLFAGDTRVLSTYRFSIAGHPWRVFARSRQSPSIAQWDMENPRVRTPGGDIDEGDLHFRLQRRLRGALHDCLSVTAFTKKRCPLRLSLQVDADFADLFQVKDQSTAPRLSVQRTPGKRELVLRYERRGFSRGLHVRFDVATGPLFVGAQVVFDVLLEPQQPWTCCVSAEPEIDGRRVLFHGDPHGPDAPDITRSLRVDCEPLLAEPFRRGALDLDRLAIQDDGDPPYIAAGAPWFLALFGRDTLVTSLMAGLMGPWHTQGALLALGKTQAHARDDFRDALPGKIAHELRRGELARFDAIPHTPYFGTHDAPALYVLALWNAFRWTGDEAILDAHLGTAEEALGWCETSGDEDGDGFLEYRTRSSKGYKNQGWKDAGDAIVHESGADAELPIATVELQGYWYSALLAMAELLEHRGDESGADRQRALARQLRTAVEERFWMDHAGIYALALDRKKQLVTSISSNPGHLLFCGLPSEARAERVAARLLARDMYSGYGVRTLSAEHAWYNPLSYQRGSVWPHDNALLAAGLVRYGLREQAAGVLKGILEAAALFEGGRLPELFCGFARDAGPPLPYAKANVPQAWSAAVPILAAQLFLGLVPDAPNRRCHVAPWLPEWLPVLDLHGVTIGQGELSIRVERTGSAARVTRVECPGIEIVEGLPQAILWGRPATGSASR